AVCRGGECSVSPAASTTVGNGHQLTFAGQVAEDVTPVAVADQGTGRNMDDEIFAMTAVTIVPSAAAAPLGAPVLAMSDVSQVVRSRYCLHDDAAAVATVAAVWAATRNVFLASEATASRSPVSSLDVNNHAVDKHKTSLLTTGAPAHNTG